MNPGSPTSPDVTMPPMDVFVEITGGHPEMSASIAATAIEEMNAQHDTVLRALAARNFPAAAAALHSLRGSAGVLGIEGFGQFLLEMENACHAGDRLFLEGCLDAFRNAWNSCRKGLELLGEDLGRQSA
jgi:HPt (histidine-containing phosphotransfer) domain-containing protein